MYLKQSRFKNGRVYLSIVESYMKDRISKTRTIESLGYLDELEELYEDPIAHFKTRALELTRQKAAENEPVLLEFHPRERIDMRKENVRNLGHAILSVYYHRLGIDRFWDNRRMRGDFAYNPNAIFKLLTYSRVIEPASKKRTYEMKGRFIDRMDFSISDMYRCLSFFAGYEKDLVSWLDEAIWSIRGRSTTICYYDVTNYYFEIETEDELRRRGVSKEHRPNPIVQMGLMLDGDGIPIDYELFEGNINDCLTLMPCLKKMRSRHDSSRIIVVADKGLNTSDNIAATILDGNGFVFSQSVRLAPKELKQWVLDKAGYSVGEDFRIKDRIDSKTITITAADGKKKKEDIEVRQIIFWSRDFAERARAERASVIEKSLNAVKRGGVSAAKAHTALRYVIDTAVVAKTGEIANHVLTLDSEKIARDEAMDGYYCLITSELDRDPRDIIDIYKGLWRIEETFRVTKSILEYRPIYVSRHDRIHAHFMICYVALVLLRLIQADLKWEYSAEEIADDIASMNGALMKKNYYLFSHRTHLSDVLGRLCDIDLSRQILSAKDLRDILAKTKKS